MRHDTALTVCPDYPPQDLECIPFYKGNVSTPQENRAVFRNLWQQGDALLQGSMALDRRDMRLTTNTFSNTVIGSCIQSRDYPKCGFTIKLTERTQSSDKLMEIEVDKIYEANNHSQYIRRRLFLGGDGCARAQTLRQGLTNDNRLDPQAARRYEPLHELTTEELGVLDDLYVYINMQHEKQLRQPSLRRYIGRRAMQTWRYLTD